MCNHPKKQPIYREVTADGGTLGQRVVGWECCECGKRLL
jgi:hypothetical protein